jgi:hypothetical protein
VTSRPRMTKADHKLFYQLLVDRAASLPRDQHPPEMTDAFRKFYATEVDREWRRWIRWAAVQQAAKGGATWVCTEKWPVGEVYYKAGDVLKGRPFWGGPQAIRDDYLACEKIARIPGATLPQCLGGVKLATIFPLEP